MLATAPTILDTEPNWIVTSVVGAVLGALVSAYGTLLGYPIRRLRRNHYVGDWFEYHWTYHSGQRHLWRARLCIRRGYLQSYSVQFDHLPQQVSQPSGGTAPAAPSEDRVLRYRGEMHLRENHVVITLNAHTHEESLVYRFRQWIPSNKDPVPGLWMSFDHTGAPAAGAALLSDRELSEAEVEAGFRSAIESAPGLLRVAQSYRPARRREPEGKSPPTGC
jgi:hypothetical protein